VSCVPPFYFADFCRQSFIHCCTSLSRDVTVLSPQLQDPHRRRHQDEQMSESTVTQVQSTTPTVTQQETCKYKSREWRNLTMNCYSLSVQSRLFIISCTIIWFLDSWYFVSGHTCFSQLCIRRYDGQLVLWGEFLRDILSREHYFVHVSLQTLPKQYWICPSSFSVDVGLHTEFIRTKL